jgi:dTMP kinase
MFFNIEGPEGSGKTSLIKEIKKYCLEDVQLKENVVFTKESGNEHSKACQQIRQLILDPENEDLDTESILFLLLADRAQNMSKVVIPSIKKGKIVVSDRGYFSTVSYQGFGEYRGDSSMLCFIESCNEIATQGIMPDVVILLQTSPEIGLSRATKTEFNKADKFESKDIEFHQRVSDGYKYSYEQYSSPYIKFHVINTDDKTVAEVNSEAMEYFKSHIRDYLSGGAWS